MTFCDFFHKLKLVLTVGLRKKFLKKFSLGGGGGGLTNPFLEKHQWVYSIWC